MKCCSSFIELIRGNSTKCDLATNTNNSSKRQSTKMSFTLQRDRENWVQIDGDLIDRSTGWLVGGLTCSLASMSIKISWGPIDLHKIAHCQTISLRIRSHLDKCAKSRAFFLLIFSHLISAVVAVINFCYYSLIHSRRHLLFYARL